MTPQDEDPGASIQEAVSGSRTISGVPTSITAFLGRARRGPVDQPVVISSYTEFDQIFGGLWSESALGHSVSDFFRLGGSRAIIVRVHQSAPGDTAAVVLGSGAAQLALEAAAPGAWGSRLSVRIDNDGIDPNNPTHFTLTVIDEGAGRVETHRDVSFATASRRRVDAVLQQRSDLVRIPGALPTSDRPQLPQQGAATGGNDGGPVGAANYTTAPNMRGQRRGLFALDHADTVNLIVIPPYTASADVDEVVVTDTIAYAAHRGAIFIMDPPSAWDAAAAAAEGVSAPSFPISSNAALYFPRIRQADPNLEGRLATFAPSGAVAGVIARTDARSGVWKTPAGITAALDGVAGLTVPLTDEDSARLSPLGINCLRAVSRAGPVIWGGRTRQADDESEWKYLAVRRLLLFIEHSVERGTQWVVTEPNDEGSWSQIRLNVGSFLDGLFRQGAFAGRSPQEAYFVKCDSETTTQQDVESGMVNFIIGVAPLKPAEFITLPVRQPAGPPKRRRSRWRLRPSPRIRRKGG